ncbi:MAG: hypothetical protein ACRCZG_07250, partial [Culicoidibacterales bacterium]
LTYIEGGLFLKLKKQIGVLMVAGIMVLTGGIVTVSSYKTEVLAKQVKVTNNKNNLKNVKQQKLSL